MIRLQRSKISSFCVEAHHLPNKGNINASVKQCPFFSHCLKSSPKLLSRSRESFTPSKLAFQGLPRTQLMTNSTRWKLDILVQFRKWWIRLKGWLASKWKMPLLCLTCWAVYLSILFVCEFLQYGNVCHLSNKMGSKTIQMSPFRSCDLVSQKKKCKPCCEQFWEPLLRIYTQNLKAKLT